MTSFTTGATCKKKLKTVKIKLDKKVCMHINFLLHAASNRHDGGIFGIGQAEFNEFKKEHSSIRVYKYLMCNKPNSPNGVLAKYR